MVFVSVVTEFPISLDEEITDEMVDSGKRMEMEGLRAGNFGDGVCKSGDRVSNF